MFGKGQNSPTKVLSLDWIEVESRIKKICNQLLKPINELATESKVELKREQVKLTNVQIDTEKLNNAVFYKNNKSSRNVFNVMTDEIYEMRANQVQHMKKTSATLEIFAQQIRDMQGNVLSYNAKVASWEDQLKMHKSAVEKTRVGIEKLVEEMQANLTQSHTSLN